MQREKRRNKRKDKKIAKDFGRKKEEVFVDFSDLKVKLQIETIESNFWAVFNY